MAHDDDSHRQSTALTLPSLHHNVTVECQLGERVSQPGLIKRLVPDGAVLVAVASLSGGPVFRVDRLCPDQVECLADMGGAWPPILVRRDGLVIDGVHRVAAARRLGLVRILAVYFDGDIDDAYVEFVRRNVTHGLVPSLGERKEAANRVLQVHPDWSDRRVAEVYTLFPKTVGGLPPTSNDIEDLDLIDGGVREERDHRLRPTRRCSVRRRVIEVLRAQPDATLRTIAVAAGVSPETVRLVRLNLTTSDTDPVEGEPVRADVPEAEPADEQWRDNAALVSSDRGSDLLAWMERTRVDNSDLSWVDAVPLSRVYMAAEEARRRSDGWLLLAKALESRPVRAR
jgi:hypothetical protein